MQTAWRERNPAARIKAAKDAIGLNPECATAYILLAEEEAVDIAEAEVKFKEAFRIAETNYRRSQQLQHQNQVPLLKQLQDQVPLPAPAPEPGTAT
jgi:hypothetical protein